MTVPESGNPLRVDTADERRLTLLEESLVECLDWIREQDIYDDQLAPDTAWLNRTVYDSYGQPYQGDGLNAYVEKTFAIVERAQEVLGPEAEASARARAGLRARKRERQQSSIE